jgi:hypothetical protein
MEENIEVIGKMVNKMVKENFSSLLKKYGKKEYGQMVKEYHGKIEK